MNDETKDLILVSLKPLWKHNSAPSDVFVKASRTLPHRAHIKVCRK